MWRVHPPLARLSLLLPLPVSGDSRRSLSLRSGRTLTLARSLNVKPSGKISHFDNRPFLYRWGGGGGAGEPLRRGQWTGAGSRIPTLNVRGRDGSGGLLLKIEVGPKTSIPPFPEPEWGRGLLPPCESSLSPFQWVLL